MLTNQRKKPIDMLFLLATIDWKDLHIRVVLALSERFLGDSFRLVAQEVAVSPSSMRVPHLFTIAPGKTDPTTLTTSQRRERIVDLAGMHPLSSNHPSSIMV